MIKRIVQKDQNQKNGEIREFLRRLYMEKKSRLRAFARTRAKNPLEKPLFEWVIMARVR